MELLIDDKAINLAVLEAVDSLGLIPKEDAIGRTIDINEFRRKYCGGTSSTSSRKPILQTAVG